MRNSFEHKLGKLNNDLIRMGGMIEEAIASAITALRDNNTELAKKVVENDIRVDDAEKSIESQCLSIILREQPVARDLRKVSAAMKMVTDMERIADNAADIAEISMIADVSAIMHIVSDIQTMSEKVINMVSGSVDAFVRTDTKLAEQTIKADDEVDNLFISTRNRIVELIKNDSCSGEVAVDALMIVKYLERIADHAVNVCEWIEFYETGEYKNTQII